MIGRLLGSRTNRAQGVNPFGAMRTPPSAGVLSCRVLDPVDEAVTHAEVTVTDARGFKVVSGETDPYGMFVATLPHGEYRIAISASGFLPHRANATVGADALATLGDIRLQVAQPLALPQPGDWEIEPAHTAVTFTARHIGMAKVHGRFGNFAGAIRIGESMETSAMHVVIDTSSIDTNFPTRDAHLRSADFLDVENYPTLEFYSDRFIHKGGNHWSVVGALSLHGVTRTVTLETDFLGLGKGMEGETRAACRAVTELHRDDFTISWQTMLAKGIAVVGPSITVELDVQIVPKGVAYSSPSTGAR
jgi:polyisoprenoid-binding protein YceI